MHLRSLATAAAVAALLAASAAHDGRSPEGAGAAGPPPATLAAAGAPTGGRTGNVIVRFKQGTTLAAVAGAVRGAQGAVERRPAGARFVVVRPEGGASVDATVAALSADAGVEYAEPDLAMSILRTPNDVEYGTYQWDMPQISAPAAWDTTTGSAGVTIAVIDTGVDGTHPDLAGKLVAGKNFVTVPIGSSSNAAGAVKITLTSPHSYQTGDQVAIAGHTRAAYNGTWTITKVDATSFTLNGSSYTAYPAVSTATNSGGLVLITTGSAHGLSSGNVVSISGDSVPAVNGTWGITVVTATQFTLNGSSYSTSGTGGTISAGGGTAQGTSTRDDHFHGTFVASIAGANTDNTEGMAGVCWACAIMPIKVMDQTGNGSMADVAAGIDWAVAHGAKVINLSLGSGAGNLTLQASVDNAWNAGAIVVGASGNDNGPVLFPAAYANALAVGANDQAGARASFSNFGPELDVMAPGAGVLGALCSCGSYAGGYGIGDGTSFAAPHASGVAGLMISAGITDKNTIVSRLKSTATDMDVAGVDNNTGWGRINAAAAVGDVTPPAVSITAPANGATVSGNSVVFSATASDAGGVQKARFWVDNYYLGFDSSAPYAKTWNTTTYSNGPHTLKVEALDMANNSTITTIGVTVSNADTTPPAASISAPANGATVMASVVAFSATASDVSGIQKVRFWVDNWYLGYDTSAPYGKTWDTTTYRNGPHTLKIEALDTWSNSTVRTITVTVMNVDTTAPAVSITAPANGATVSGSAVTFSATASDAGGTQKVRFWVDGSYLGYDTSAPYAKTWDTTTYANGAHTLKVEALDWANNSTITTISVAVSN